MTWNPVHWVEVSRAFLADVSLELKKVTWPTQKETVAPGTAAPSSAADTRTTSCWAAAR